ncbi:Sugar transferase involved in LPS biosynthesis (colanic, teichoic acid) [Loktanella salsilacus]|uniref:Sugar transferase involved in LPS biosynthesis (Colanic, teichoic acid) n=1 Tax=Loktanella salsilacus TaxID=195913 RepID=A0A1I4K4M3_9RHOB|nr:sugar transferase [Loktanella salsilacus]SFL73433.1 Sugar transferase involved in LPS biosynthesis (colanic, teichoic acid) [Loktanella salsilacus]
MMYYHNLMQDAAKAGTMPGTRRNAVRIAMPVRGVYRNGGKRIVDIALVLLALPFITVIIALLALAVASQGGRSFYTQDRVGRGGRLYKIWKLRTMIPDADAALERHLAAVPAARAEWNATQKLKKDPRITRVGLMLRKTSMDELPQLWNVLRGDMSLIGPRPMLPSQTGMYPGTAYYHLRPGISGSWQVSARNESHFADRASYDTAYYSKVTFAADAGILAATLRVVMRATGH